MILNLLNICQDLIQKATEKVQIYTLHDLAEILILSSIIYFFLVWLSRDKKGYPIFALYGYFFLLVATHYASLQIVRNLLLFSTPVALILVIILHQSSIQKNFVTYKNITTKKNNEKNWLEELTKTLLSMINKRKEIICIIERSDCLKEFLKTSYYLNADLSKETLELFLDNRFSKNLKESKDRNSVFWISNMGKIISNKAFVKIAPEPVWITEKIQNLPIWKQDGIFITSKTDAIVLATSPSNRVFDFVIQGKLIENLTPQHAVELLKKQLINTKTLNGESEFHAHPNDNFSQQQLS